MSDATNKHQLVFAAIADDDTGASDLAGMLAEQQVRTLLVIDLPTPEQLQEWSRDCDAVVMAQGTRNLAPELARQKTRRALQFVQALNPRVLAIKYCSTFDSTPAGNIGPTIDVALDELCEDFTIALPALPINGRTTRDGLHYVNSTLLSDSPLRHHPLNPMTNANLVEWLQLQTARKVGLAAWSDVEAGAEQLTARFHALRALGVAIAIVDCENDAHLETICRAAVDLRLITGGSAFGIKLPSLWRERGWLRTVAETSPASPVTESGQGHLVIAGSCSEATRRQNAWFAEQGAPTFQIDPRDLLAGDAAVTALQTRIVSILQGGGACLCYTSDSPEQVSAVQRWGAEQGWSVSALGERLAEAMANFTEAILSQQPVAGLIVAGGETSGAVCWRLQLGALRVGRNIEPGVPLCVSLGRFRQLLALKSGNFGSADFYQRAVDAMQQAEAFLL
jgi:3-dehydrotetronate 4-kinase